MWRRLAVFDGGFTTDSTASGAAHEGTPPDVVAELLDGLVDRSLAVRFHFIEVGSDRVERRREEAPVSVDALELMLASVGERRDTTQRHVANRRRHPQLAV